MDDTLWTYRARPISATDGDTISVVIDHGMCIHSTQRVRVAGIDTPELFSGTDRDAGKAARDATDTWLHDADWMGEWPLRITTTKDRRSFNRYIADVTRTDGSNLAEWLIEQGHAVNVR